jgi:hypothetical protein
MVDKCLVARSLFLAEIHTMSVLRSVFEYYTLLVP